MNNVAIIPARAGSKGLLKKNVLPILGKPLIAWSIEHALNSELIDEVYVSTDCEEIKKISEDFGAKVPFLRPSEISTDTASTESAMLHFCDWASKEQVHFENLILLQATSPLRYPDSIDRAIKNFLDGFFDSLVTVTATHRFFWKNLKNPEATYDYLNRPRRQDITKNDIRFIETGSFYITRLRTFLESKNRICGKICMFELSHDESYEIDTHLDFKICELLLEQYNLKNK